MRIIFVRHGEPDYEANCLTETGKKQARTVAASLSSMGISEIFTSLPGRVPQTAAYTAEHLPLAIQTLDYMWEIHWGYPGSKIYSDGSNPWMLVFRSFNSKSKKEVQHVTNQRRLRFSAAHVDWH